jgi:hypothetical protein
MWGRFVKGQAGFATWRWLGSIRVAGQSSVDQAVTGRS